MPERQKVIKALELCGSTWDCNKECPYYGETSTCDVYADAVTLLKQQEKIKPQEEFSKILHGMFDFLWDCEIEHPIFQDTVGDLMNAVIQAYGEAVKLND